jgi:hypothetical protein
MRQGVDEIIDPKDELRVGVLALRVWADGPLPEGLRVRITSRLDLSSTEDLVTMAADTETVISAVREWLDTFVSG